MFEGDVEPTTEAILTAVAALVLVVCSCGLLLLSVPAALALFHWSCAREEFFSTCRKWTASVPSVAIALVVVATALICICFGMAMVVVTDRDAQCKRVVRVRLTAHWE